jgi:hypothetical protein
MYVSAHMARRRADVGSTTTERVILTSPLCQDHGIDGPPPVAWIMISPYTFRLRKNYAVELMGVAEAARRLGRTEARVRQLLRSGALAGQRVSGVWLVDAAAVHERATAAPEPGRPLTPGHAWQAVMAVSALVTADAPMSSLNELLMASVDRRNRRRLAANLRRPPPVERWSAWLASRAATRRYAADPSVIYHLLSDGRVSPGGARGLATAGLLAAQSSEVVDAYVREVDADSVVSAYRLEAQRTGRVRFRVVPDMVGAASGLVAGRPAPVAACLVDLMDSADSASRATAERRLQHIVDALHRLRDGPAP